MATRQHPNASISRLPDSSTCFRRCRSTCLVPHRLVRFIVLIFVIENSQLINHFACRFQRPYFEKQLRRELASEDILNPSYYLSSSSKLSRFSILEWKKRPIGYLAIDAATPDEVLTNLEDEGILEAVQRRRVIPQSDLPSHAVVRHFHVDRVYQQAGIQKDLIRTVLGEIFEADSRKGKQSQQKIDKIFVRVTSTEPEAETTWRQIGFQDSTTRKGGKIADSGVIFGHYERWLELSRARWEAVERTS